MKRFLHCGRFRPAGYPQRDAHKRHELPKHTTERLGWGAQHELAERANEHDQRADAQDQIVHRLQHLCLDALAAAHLAHVIIEAEHDNDVHGAGGERRVDGRERRGVEVKLIEVKQARGWWWR